MQLAFGITHYDSNQEPIDDLDYGEIVARYQTWGLGQEMGSGMSDPIPIKRCTPAELGLSDNGSLFFPTNKGSYRDLSFYRKKFWCFDFEAMA